MNILTFTSNENGLNHFDQKNVNVSRLILYFTYFLRFFLWNIFVTYFCTSLAFEIICRTLFQFKYDNCINFMRICFCVFFFRIPLRNRFFFYSLFVISGFFVIFVLTDFLTLFSFLLNVFALVTTDNKIGIHLKMLNKTSKKTGRESEKTNSWQKEKRGKKIDMLMLSPVVVVHIEIIFLFYPWFCSFWHLTKKKTRFLLAATVNVEWWQN